MDYITFKHATAFGVDGGGTHGGTAADGGTAAAAKGAP